MKLQRRRPGAGRTLEFISRQALREAGQSTGLTRGGGASATLDLHANRVGHKDPIRKPDGTIGVAMRGGMVRMKTMIDAARKSNPHTVVMNIGDTFHGGVEAVTRWAMPWPTC